MDRTRLCCRSVPVPFGRTCTNNTGSSSLPALFLRAAFSARPSDDDRRRPPVTAGVIVAEEVLVHAIQSRESGTAVTRHHVVIFHRRRAASVYRRTLRRDLIHNTDARRWSAIVLNTVCFVVFCGDGMAIRAFVRCPVVPPLVLRPRVADFTDRDFVFSPCRPRGKCITTTSRQTLHSVRQRGLRHRCRLM